MAAYKYYKGVGRDFFQAGVKFSLNFYFLEKFQGQKNLPEKNPLPFLN